MSKSNNFLSSNGMTSQVVRSDVTTNILTTYLKPILNWVTVEPPQTQVIPWAVPQARWYGVAQTWLSLPHLNYSQAWLIMPTVAGITACIRLRPRNT